MYKSLRNTGFSGLSGETWTQKQQSTIKTVYKRDLYNASKKANKRITMLKTYHLCYTSHQEVMYRNVEDMNRSFNCLCSALKKTDSRCLAESDIPNHHHGCYETECPDLLIRIKRQAYTCYFNEKYGRKGPLGEPGYFEMELEGLQHKLTAISYTVRNTVHHGITSTPFEWPFCSANAYFRKELGKLYVPDLLLTPAQIKAALPRRARFSPQWKMGVEGVFLRESVIETDVVENLYATPKAFNYLITRLSGEDWSQEQEADNDGRPPITLESFEDLVLQRAASREKTIAEMLRNEKNRGTPLGFNDLQLCELIDNQYIPQYRARSVYQLSSREKNNIASDLFRRRLAGEAQIRRCLVL